MFAFIFGGISRLFHKWDAVCIDNHVFRLHYRATVIIFLAAIALITSGQFIGNPIHCMSDSVSDGIMNSYCWLHSTYSVAARYEGSAGHEFAHKGVGPDVNDKAGHTYHRFYQWIGFMFVLQAGMFYFPRLLWKSAEGGVMKLLTNGLTEFDSFMNKSRRRDGVNLIEKYWNQKQTKRDTYFVKFFVCELLNFANVVGQIFFTDMFLGYQFREFGRDVLSQMEEPINVRDDPLNRVFPKVAKCTFQKFGPSGSLTKHDALCVLPLNIINEKIYVFLYLWFVFLAAVSGIWLLYRLLTIVSLEVRVDVIYRRASKQVSKDDIKACLVDNNHSALERLGDFLLLYQITKNVNPLIIKDIFEEIKPKSPEPSRANSEETQMLIKSSAPEM
jgi:hypothetical protein